MNDRAPVPLPEAMLGSVEPHAPLLRMPEPGQLLYKMTRAEDLIRSIEAGYLYFNRVDSYADFPGADPHDGQQVPLDRPGNTLARFQQAPSVSLADYYESSRSRSYACCFSLDNSPHIWANYASGSSIGKVCVVFDFGRLRARLNQTFEPGSAALDYKGLRCHQLFSVNYGVVEYVTWVSHRENVERLPNPIRYLYLKDRKYTP